MTIIAALSSSLPFMRVTMSALCLRPWESLLVVDKGLKSFAFYLFQIAAAGIISVGVWSYVEKNKYYYQEITTVYDILLDLSICLIILGGIMFLITFAGFVGALRENTCLLTFVSANLIAALSICMRPKPAKWPACIALM